jgi:FkbM family methyltransferase
LSRTRKTVDAAKPDFGLKESNPLVWLKERGYKTIIDIGANEGQFTCKILEVIPDAKYLCFEPIPEVYEQLKFNVKKYKNISIFNLALGERNGEAKININQYSPSSSILEMLELHKENFNFAIQTEQSRIRIARLDDFLSDEIDPPILLKIDVQGYEMDVLKGAERILGQSELIIIETTFIALYENQPLFEEVYDYMIGKGFKYAGNLEQLLSPKDNTILQADAIFVKK